MTRYNAEHGDLDRLTNESGYVFEYDSEGRLISGTFEKDPNDTRSWMEEEAT